MIPDFLGAGGTASGLGVAGSGAAGLASGFGGWGIGGTLMGGVVTVMGLRSGFCGVGGGVFGRGGSEIGGVVTLMGGLTADGEFAPGNGGIGIPAPGAPGAGLGFFSARKDARSLIN